jgi:YggT family protein
MSVDFLVLFIRVVTDTIVWVVIANALLSFILSPYHPVREALERIVAPFLNPIRRLMGNTGAMDFSPLILILALEFLSRILIGILVSL